jgi:hypothetical protein
MLQAEDECDMLLRTTRHHIPKDSALQGHNHGNFKPNGVDIRTPKTDWYIAVGPRERSGSWFRVPWDEWPLSDGYIFLLKIYKNSVRTSQETLRHPYKDQSVNAV